MDVVTRLQYQEMGLIYDDSEHRFKVYCIDEVVQEISADMVFDADRNGKLSKLLDSVKQFAAVNIARKILK